MGNLGEVSCGKPNVTRALCPGSHPRRLGAKVNEVNDDSVYSSSVAPNLTFAVTDPYLHFYGIEIAR